MILKKRKTIFCRLVANSESHDTHQRSPHHRVARARSRLLPGVSARIATIFTRGHGFLFFLVSFYSANMLRPSMKASYQSEQRRLNHVAIQQEDYRVQEQVRSLERYRLNCHVDACFPGNSPESSRINVMLKDGYLQHGATGHTPLAQGKFSDMYLKYVAFLTDRSGKSAEKRNLREQFGSHPDYRPKERELEKVHERRMVRFSDLNFTMKMAL